MVGSSFLVFFNENIPLLFKSYSFIYSWVWKLNMGESITNALAFFISVIGVATTIILFLLLFFSIVKIILPRKKEFYKKNKEIENANISISKHHFQNYGQTTKVGISIGNNGNDIFPKIRINEIYVTERYISDMATDLLPFEYKTCFINFEKVIEYGHTEKIPFMEIRDGGIFLLFNDGHFLVNTKKVLDDFRFRWDFKFKVFGKIKDGNFDNGIYSTFIETKTTGHEVYLQIGEIVKE